LFPLLAVVLWASAMAQHTPPPRVRPAEFGETFPVHAFANLNVGAGEAQIDLAAAVGKRPVIFFYWIAGHPRADEVFQELQGVIEEAGSDQVALYGVAIQQPGRDAAAIRKRAAEIGVKVPVLDDEGFRIGQQMRIQSVPNITILDAEGKLRLTNGASLQQTIGYEMTVEDAVRRVVRTGKLGTYGYLDRYYPATELVGKKCPDFTAELISNDAPQIWSSMQSGDKLNVLIFWSVDCPHCRKSLPEINEWLKEHAGGLNVVSMAAVPNDEVRTKTKEYCESNDFVFPTLVDDLEVARLFKITSTPTIVIIRPDGVVDSVVLSGTADFGKTMEEKIKALLPREGA
jgi:thiol-disulfide isomerase/thioredoxin